MEQIRILLDVGGTQLKGGVMDCKGRLMDDIISTPALSSESKDVIFDNFAEFITKLRSSHSDTAVAGIGMAFPGPFDYQNGISLMQGLNKYESIYGISIKDEIRKRLPELENVHFCFLHDIEAFAIGESFFGPVKDAGRILCLCIGTGAGSAFVVNHSCVKENKDGVPLNGWLYNTPFKDSIIDDYLSVRGIEKISKQVTGKALSGKELYDLCLVGDEDALTVYDLLGKDLVDAILPFIEGFKPDALIMGGQISKSFPFFGDQLGNECIKRNITICTEQETSVRAMEGLFAHMTKEEHHGT